MSSMMEPMAFIGTSTMLFFNLVSRWLATTPLPTPRSDDNKPPSKPLLRLNSRNEFHVAIFSDLHYGEEESGWGIDQDVNSTRVVNNILDSESPDFVILNGDLITGENTFLANSTKYLDVVVQPLVEHKIPWASTYGNHDSQFNLSRSGVFLEERKFNLSYTQHSPPGLPGITNYYLPLYAQSKYCDGNPLAILWFFDSQGGAPYQASTSSQTIPNWVEPSIASWFVKENAELTKKYGKALPSLAFVHIPPSAFLNLQNKLLPKVGDESTHFPGLNDDVPLAAQGDGSQDLAFMNALVEVGVHSVYSGHDHGDSWCARAEEKLPLLCFCKHTGYGGYGNWRRGSRNLRLTFGQEMEVETWVRMETGEVVQRVGLNETYGTDVYPLEDGEILLV